MDTRTNDSETGTGLNFLGGGGAMGELIARMDWTGSPLGPPQGWPQSLRTTLSLCLASNFPLCFIWGPHRVQFYNDGYWPICADKHPQSMGQDYKACWQSAWPVIGPQFERCFETGETSFVTDSRMFLDRSGVLEETFFTYSYSPIRDETGSVAGIFHPVTETTHLVLAERRLGLLRRLADATASAVSLDSALNLAAGSLAHDTLDVPFVLIYRVDLVQQRAVRAVATEALADSAFAPASIDLKASPDAWGLVQSCRSGQAIALKDVQASSGPFACGPYEEAPDQALACPIRVTPGDPVSLVMVAGVSSRRPLDEAYLRFYAMLQDAVTTAVSNAQAYADTQRRAEVLQQLDKAKTDFFSNVSHEFRTPLTLMLGPLEDMLNRPDEGLTAGGRDQLRLVYRNGRRLLKLVNTLLEFSRNEAGRARAVFESTDLTQMTEEICGLFRSTIEHGGLLFTVDCQPLSGPVPVDRDMWEKILLNLLSNAFKFTMEGEIIVRLSEEEGHAVLRVIDTGAGIPAHDLQKVFERFHRVQGTAGRSFEGSGIGLALVRDLVQLHEGEISVDSTPDIGSVFQVRMPMHPASRPLSQAEQAADPASSAPGDTGQIGAHLEELQSWIHQQAVATISGDQAQLAGQGRPRILLADDNADMRGYVRSLLADSYTLDEVANGQEALARAQAQRPDLVLTDVMMPGLDGFGLLSALRADPATRSVPVIMLSARAGDEARVEGLDAGADDYLVKPFSAQELKARIRTNLALHQLRQEVVRRAEQDKSALEAEAQARIFDTALSNTADFVYTFDLAGRFTYVNRSLLDLWGKTADEALGKNFFELDYPADLAGRLQAQIQQVITSKAPIRDETPYSSVQGTRDYEYIFVPVLASDGSVMAVSGSTRDITDRRLAVQSLQADSRKKDEFLAMLAHELRNPLSAVSNAVSVLKMSARPESITFATDVIQRQVKQFSRLIDDLLDVSRITSGKIRLQCEPIDAVAVLRDAIESVRPLMDKYGHELKVELSALHLPLLADATRIEQVVVNLLTNAAKYTEGKGCITLSASHDGQDVLIAVRDEGIGIAPDKLADVFELFTQGERSIARSEGGLGVGLTIVKKLVQLHGGSVEAHSGGAGQGSTFTVRLPAAAQQAPAPGTLPHNAASPASARVLVVDDNVDTANGLAEALQLLGNEVQVAYNGRAALDVARSFGPSVVLLDIGLPGMDGYQVARHLREELACAGATIIAITGYGQDDDRRRSTEAGFNHHLVKPVDFSDLLSAMGLPA